MKMSPKTSTLNEILGIPDIQLRVPPYQRSYAWTSEQAEELFDDIRTAHDGGHFIGAIVLNDAEDNAPEIIDGQQRICTLVILLGVIRDKYQELSEADVGRVQYSYMENQWPSDEGKRFKVVSGRTNMEIFRDFVLRRPKDEKRKVWTEFLKIKRASKSRNKNLAGNSQKFSELIDTDIKNMDATAKLAHLRRLEETVVKKLEFLPIRVPNLDHAFVIFETLNDRGLDLSAGDLVKNHLLAKLTSDGQSLDDLSDEWDRVLENLNCADLTRFLRHYLLATHQKVTKDDVFPLLKKLVKDLGGKAVLDELKVATEVYGELVQPSPETASEQSEILENLKKLRAQICYSVLLPGKRYLSDSDFLDLLKLVEILTFRYSSVCGKASNILEIAYHESAKLLTESKGAALQDARVKLVAMIPESEEFIAAFKDQSIGNKDVAEYLLRKVEMYLDEEKTPASSKTLHIEHILPQKPSAEWSTEIREDAEKLAEFVPRWGNLTLLSGKKNQQISNLGFDKKKTKYDESNIKLTKALLEYSNWGFEQIAKRQLELATLADKIWTREPASKYSAAK